MNNLISVIRDSSNLIRWNGKLIIGKRRTISEHMFEVAHLSNYIVTTIIDQSKDYSDRSDYYHLMRSNVFQLALTHDLAEVFTNDVSYVAKSKSKSLRNSLESLENSFIIDLGFPATAEYSDEVRLIVKTADIIAVAIEIQEQLSFNNTRDFTLDNVDSIINTVLNKYSDISYTDEYRVCKTILEVDKPWLKLSN